MVAYSFQPQFIMPIETGRKCQTIRSVGLRRHVRPGEIQVSDDWPHVKISTNRRYLNISPMEGSGDELVETIRTRMEAEQDQLALTECASKLREGDEDSYLATFVQWLADELEEAIGKMAGA